MIYAFEEPGDDPLVKIGYTNGGIPGVYECLVRCQTGNPRRLTIARVYDIPVKDGEVRRLLSLKGVPRYEREWYPQSALPALHELYLLNWQERCGYLEYPRLYRSRDRFEQDCLRRKCENSYTVLGSRLGRLAHLCPQCRELHASQ